MQKPQTPVEYSNNNQLVNNNLYNKNENMKSVKYSVYFGALLGVEEIDLQSTLAQYSDFLVLSVVAKGEKCFGFATFKSEETINRLILDKFITVGSKKVRVLPCASNKDSESKDSLVCAINSSENKNGHIKFEIKRKDGVRIESPVPLSAKKVEYEIIIRNFGKGCYLKAHPAIFGSKREFSVNWFGDAKWTDIPPNKKVLLIHQGSSHCMKVTFGQREGAARYGIFSLLISCNFVDFVTTAKISVMVAEQEPFELLKPALEYFDFQDIEGAQRTIVPAYPPDRKSKSYFNEVTYWWTEDLPQYPIPEKLHPDIDEQNQEPWDPETHYRKKMHTLLWMEESQQNKLLKRFDKRDIEIIPVHQFQIGEKKISSDNKLVSKLLIPNLDEKMPVILNGDAVCVWLPGTTDYEFEGFIIASKISTQKSESYLLVEFCEDFHNRFTEKTKFCLRFCYNRIPMRLMHRAISNVHLNAIFPNPKVWVEYDNLLMSHNHFRDNNLNDSQRLVVMNIVNKIPTENNLPFLIKGAYGTGKTRTIIESIYQIFQNQKDCKILVCAQSIRSTEYITEKIAEFLNPNQMLALYPFRYSKSNVPKKILPYTCYLEDKEIFSIPKKENLHRFQVFVSTCLTASTLFNVDVGKVFTHIFIDEAAQMTEVEALIPISLANTSTAVVYSGDEMQHGPLIQAVPVKQYGLTKSVMERLLNNTYSISLGTDTCIELIDNYKLHPDILRFSSDQFYDGTLETLATPTLINWSRLPNKKFPIYFYGVKGQDLREGDSPSFFNIYEALAVVEVLQSLVQTVSPNDIGVITPYFKQIQKISQLCSQRKLG